MGIKVHINYQAEISELVNKYSCFAFLKNACIPKDEMHTWYTNNSYWGYSDETTYELNVMFVGKTGYGKSTTLNKIVGKNVFETSDVSVCTKDLYCAMYRINSFDKSFICFSDLPGVGESNYADDHYYTWYKEMLEKSDVVVYLLRADQRDFAVDEMLFTNLFQGVDRKKVILALNYADKIEPLNRNGGLTSAQIDSLNRKVNDVSKIFGIFKNDILYYSATDGINLENLVSIITKKLKQRMR